MKYTYILILSLLMSCNLNKFEYTYPQTKSFWVIEKINKDQKVPLKLCSYEAVSRDTTDFAQNTTWLIDTIGAFNVGDTVWFTKK